MPDDIDNLRKDALVYGGYTRDQLTEAFSLVKPAENWKYPISASIPDGTDEKLVTCAIIFFTGSIPDFFTDSDGERYVLASGYYNEIGS